MADTEIAPTFSREHDELPEYRQLSPLAIFAFVLAGLSITAVIHPLLWVIPATGAVVALAAIRKIDRSPELTGRGLATFSLFAAIFLLTLAVSWTMSKQSMLERQAKVHAATWLQLFQEGKIREAHQLAVQFENRLPKGASLDKHYEKKETDQPPDEDDADLARGPAGPSPMPMPMMMPAGGPSPADELTLFLQNPSLKRLIDSDGKFTFEHIGNGPQVRRTAQVTVVELLYKLMYEQGVPESEILVIRLARTVALGHAFWQVEDYELAKEKPTTRS